ncbi:MAG: hypothetical protein AAGF24_08150 [Cyanobacteria bacterium P01_H01_bin.121]
MKPIRRLTPEDLKIAAENSSPQIPVKVANGENAPTVGYVSGLYEAGGRLFGTVRLDNSSGTRAILVDLGLHPAATYTRTDTEQDNETTNNHA